MVSCSGIAAQHNAVGAWKRVLQGCRAVIGWHPRVVLPSRYADQLPFAVTEKWNRLSAYDQRHLLAVGDDLVRRGSPEVVVLAGVLHDIGKPAHTWVGSRVAVVLIEWFGPTARCRARRIGGQMFLVNQVQELLRHSTTGADFLAAKGVSSDVVWLVRHHEVAGSHPYLWALQAADSQF